MGTSISVPQSERDRIQRDKKNKLLKEQTSLQQSQVAAQNGIYEIQKNHSNALTQMNSSNLNRLKPDLQKKGKASQFKVDKPIIEQEENRHINIDQRQISMKKSNTQNIKNTINLQKRQIGYQSSNRDELQRRFGETKKIRISSQRQDQDQEDKKQIKKYPQTLNKDKKEKFRREEDNDNDRCNFFGNKVNPAVKQASPPEVHQNINFDECNWDIPKETANVIQEKKKFQPETSVILNHNFAETNLSPDSQESKRKWKTRRQIMQEVIEGRRESANDSFMFTNFCQPEEQQFAFLHRNDNLGLGICKNP